MVDYTDLKIRQFEDRVKGILSEDLGYGDITTDALIDSNLRATAKLFLREPGVVAGIYETAAFFTFLGCTVNIKVEEGETVEANEVLFVAKGLASSLLIAERSAAHFDNNRKSATPRLRPDTARRKICWPSNPRQSIRCTASRPGGVSFAVLIPNF